ncbi:MAG: HAMP domain-containing protein, partial [Actinobacteria bacterium]|nr:HAMP domain-containing protein [Actinomycetota bacterium]
APTLRLRLTRRHGARFLVSGIVLLVVTYLIFRNSTGVNLIVQPTSSNGAPGGDVSGPTRRMAEEAYASAVQRNTDALHQGLLRSGIVLAVMAAGSIALGWLVAGRVLRPLRTMTATARRISERNLHERLSLPGPKDELKDLADTVDDLLSRLETAFGAQQRFVANAAHELRTPMTLWRALLEETLTDPDADIDSFRATSRRLLALGEDQERLLESLLTLASSERGLGRREPFDLAALAATVLRDAGPEAAARGLRVDTELDPAPAAGDGALAARLVRNLVDNAISHNASGGSLHVRTGTAPGGPFIAVANDGPAIPPGEVDRLFEPFQRLGTGRTGPNDDHHGLGLSIVRAIAVAHGA